LNALERFKTAPAWLRTVAPWPAQQHSPGIDKEPIVIKQDLGGAADLLVSLATVAAALALALLLAGCGGGGDEPAPAQDRPAPAAQPAEAVAGAAPALQMQAPAPSVRLDGCVVDEYFQPRSATPVRALAVDGRLLGNALSDERGQFKLHAPAGQDVSLAVDQRHGDVMKVATGHRSRALVTCLVDPSA
jgi:hypothetical protein